MKIFKISLFVLVFIFCISLCACDSTDIDENESFKFDLGGNYLFAERFSEGLALVKNADGYAYIKNDGTTSFTVDAVSLGSFCDGMAWYKLSDGKGGYINKEGIACGESINGFGLAEVYDFENGIVSVTSAQAYGVDSYVIDKTGKEISTFRRFINTGEYKGFHEGIAAFKMQGGELFGYVKSDGKVLSEAIYDYAGDFSCGLAKVISDGTVKYIGTDGKIVFSLDAGVESEKFSDDVLLFKDNTGYRYCKKDGGLLLGETFERADNFNNGYAAVMKQGKWAVIDKQGTVKFYAPENTSEVGEYGDVVAYKVGDKWGLMDSNGDILQRPIFESVGKQGGGFIACRFNSKWGYVKV